MTTTTTVGSKFTALLRSGKNEITNHCWGTNGYYENGRYVFNDYCPKFGGMQKCRRRVFSATELNDCDSVNELHRIIQPRKDTSAGDPQNYAPHSSALCDFSDDVLSALE